MAAKTTLKTEKYLSKYTWHVSNAKEWQIALKDEDCKVETEDILFDEFKNVKWYENKLFFFTNSILNCNQLIKNYAGKQLFLEVAVMF